ncbi:MAG: universal stress protein, partial [Chloroflexi bacterium]|nr:universal stress protein [Chloroflexota bacterium]
KAKEFQEAGIATVESYHTLGSAAIGISDFTQSSHASLVALCTHGRSGIGRWVLGSVAEKLVLSSGAPVLIVRPQ